MAALSALQRKILLQAKIESLDLPDWVEEALYEAEIKTVEDILNLKLEDLIAIEGMTKEGITVIMDTLDRIGLGCNESEEVTGWTREDHPGVYKCNALREIRREIAKLNGIKYYEHECYNSNPCEGTCPLCDEEIAYLEEKLEEKEQRGEKIIFSSNSMWKIEQAFNIDPYAALDVSAEGGEKSFWEMLYEEDVDE